MKFRQSWGGCDWSFDLSFESMLNSNQSSQYEPAFIIYLTLFMYCICVSTQKEIYEKRKF